MILNLAYRTARGVGLSAAAGSLLLAGCTTAGPSAGPVGPNAPGPAVAAAAVRLVSFDTCEQALDELKAAAEPHVGPYGLQPGWDRPVDLDVAPEAAAGDGSAGDGVAAEPAVPGEADAPAAEADGGAAFGAQGTTAEGGRAAPPNPEAPDHSTTNVHEAGVDEPDLVKTDGRRLVTLQHGLLRVVSLERAEVTGTLELPGTSEQMLVSGDRALVVSHAPGEPTARSDAPAPGLAPPRLVPEEVELLLVDIAGAPRVVERLRVDGGYVDARLVGSTAQVVLRSAPQVPTVYPDGVGSEDAAREANLQALGRSEIDDWLPGYTYRSGGREEQGRLVDCADVRHPDVYSGTAMLNVVTVDLAAGLQPLDSVSVLGDGQTVYATGESLYIAGGHQPWAADENTRTNIHKFGVSGNGSPDYRASGAVDGRLLNQYAMSEHDGVLRVATTTEDARRPAGGGDDGASQVPASESQVVTLAERDGALETIGRVGGLGKGERIYAVRFMGSVGYVVTFRETDPLYTVDLSDPADPQVVGELKILGYSAYLHPAGGGRLIGVGQDATSDGRTVGTQLSLFDVTDLAAPERVDTYGLPDSWSEVERDPHAFLYWPADGLVVVPVQREWAVEPLPAPDSGGVAPERRLPPPGEALVLRLAGDRFAEVGAVRHPIPGAHPGDAGWFDATIRRSLVVGDTLWTVSAAGVLGSDVDDLSERAWVPFGVR